MSFFDVFSLKVIFFACSYSSSVTKLHIPGIEPNTGYMNSSKTLSVRFSSSLSATPTSALKTPA